MRILIASVLAMLAALGPEEPKTGSSAVAARDVVDTGFLIIDRGEGLLPISVPRDEELQMDVLVDVGVLGDLDAGDVVLSSGVEAYAAGLPSAHATESAPVTKRETGWVKSYATGSYLGYSLKHELNTRLLPQGFPWLFYKDTQGGSENRRRELRIGTRDNAYTAEYRSDRHCKGCDNPEHFIESKWLWGDAAHCKKCKKLEHRVWKDSESRVIPAGTVDMLSAVYLARSLVRQGAVETTFPVMNDETIWMVSLKRGPRKRLETAAGKFDCQQIVLSTTFPEDANTPEAVEDQKAKGSKFSGLFGIQGNIKIWLEAKTGVPVLIEGELPVPLPLVDHLHVSVQLKSFKGVPPEFKPVK
jgi:hypothetical protein